MSLNCNYFFSSFFNVEDMITVMGTHAQRPFYMTNRDGEDKLFMYSPKCHAHFSAGAVTTVMTDGKAYFTVGVPPEENPAFDQTLLKHFHMTHLPETQHKRINLNFVDIFVEHDHLVHTAFTQNPAKNSHPYNPKHDIEITLETMEEFFKAEENTIFDEYKNSRRHLKYWVFFFWFSKISKKLKNPFSRQNCSILLHFP